MTTVPKLQVVASPLGRRRKHAIQLFTRLSDEEIASCVRSRSMTACGGDWADLSGRRATLRQVFGDDAVVVNAIGSPAYRKLLADLHVIGPEFIFLSSRNH